MGFYLGICVGLGKYQVLGPLEPVFSKQQPVSEGTKFPDHVLMYVTARIRVRVRVNPNPNPNPFFTRQQPYLTRQHYFKK